MPELDGKGFKLYSGHACLIIGMFLSYQYLIEFKFSAKMSAKKSIAFKKHIKSSHACPNPLNSSVGGYLIVTFPMNMGAMRRIHIP